MGGVIERQRQLKPPPALPPNTYARRQSMYFSITEAIVTPDNSPVLSLYVVRRTI